jgi:HlyD family secretion protein
VIRLSAFSRRTTPELKGTVSRVAADLIQDQNADTSYYTARITVDRNELKRLDGLKLVPGMPVEAFIQTGQRTALSYLVKPLSDQVKRVFRED